MKSTLRLLYLLVLACLLIPVSAHAQLSPEPADCTKVVAGSPYSNGLWPDDGHYHACVPNYSQDGVALSLAKNLPGNANNPGYTTYVQTQLKGVNTQFYLYPTYAAFTKDFSSLGTLPSASDAFSFKSGTTYYVVFFETSPVDGTVWNFAQLMELINHEVGHIVDSTRKDESALATFNKLVQLDFYYFDQSSPGVRRNPCNGVFLSWTYKGADICNSQTQTLNAPFNNTNTYPTNGSILQAITTAGEPFHTQSSDWNEMYATQFAAAVQSGMASFNQGVDPLQDQFILNWFQCTTIWLKQVQTNATVPPTGLQNQCAATLPNGWKNYK